MKLDGQQPRRSSRLKRRIEDTEPQPQPVASTSTSPPEETPRQRNSKRQKTSNDVPTEHSRTTRRSSKSSVANVVAGASSSSGSESPSPPTTETTTTRSTRASSRLASSKSTVVPEPILDTRPSVPKRSNPRRAQPVNIPIPVSSSSPDSSPPPCPSDPPLTSSTPSTSTPASNLSAPTSPRRLRSSCPKSSNGLRAISPPRATSRKSVIVAQITRVRTRCSQRLRGKAASSPASGEASSSSLAVSRPPTVEETTVTPLSPLTPPPPSSRCSVADDEIPPISDLQIDDTTTPGLPHTNHAITDSLTSNTSSPAPPLEGPQPVPEAAASLAEEGAPSSSIFGEQEVKALASPAESSETPLVSITASVAPLPAGPISRCPSPKRWKGKEKEIAPPNEAIETENRPLPLSTEAPSSLSTPACQPAASRPTPSRFITPIPPPVHLPSLPVQLIATQRLVPITDDVPPRCSSPTLERKVSGDAVLLSQPVLTPPTPTSPPSACDSNQGGYFQQQPLPPPVYAHSLPSPIPISPFYQHPPPTPSLNLAHDILADARSKLQQDFGRTIPTPVLVRTNFGCAWSWQFPYGSGHPHERTEADFSGEPMDVDVDMNEVPIPSSDASHSAVNAQPVTCDPAGSAAVGNENVVPEETAQHSSSLVPVPSQSNEGHGGLLSASVAIDPLDADADADGDTDEDEEDAQERYIVLQDVMWNGESDTSSRVDESFDTSLTAEGEDEDDSELILPTVEQQQDIAVVEHFFAHSAAPTPPSTPSAPSTSAVTIELTDAPSLSSTPVDRQQAAWFWASYSVPWAPRVASPLAACCYIAPSPEETSPGSAHRKRFRGSGSARVINPDERESGIWKMACRSRIAEVMRMYKEPTIRALVEQELAEFQSVRGRASTIPWYLVDPDNFDDWPEDDDDFSSSESDDEDEIYIGEGAGAIPRQGLDTNVWENPSWKVESGGADTKQNSVPDEPGSVTLRSGSPESPLSPELASPTFTQAFSISGSGDQSGPTSASSPYLPPSACLECDSPQYGQRHFLPIPPPPLSSMPADLGHLNDEDMEVLEEESLQGAMEGSSSELSSSSYSPSPSPQGSSADPNANTRSLPRGSSRPMRQRRGGGKGTPVDASRRRQWFLGLVPESSNMHGSLPMPHSLHSAQQTSQFGISQHEQYSWALFSGNQFTTGEGATPTESAASMNMMFDWDRLLASVPTDANQPALQRQDESSHATALQPHARDERTFDWSGNQHSTLQQQDQHGYFQDQSQHQQQQLHQSQFEDMGMMCSSEYSHSINSSSSLAGLSGSPGGSGSQITMTASTLSFALG